MAFKIHIYRELNFSYTPVIGSLSDEDLHLMVLAFQIESKGSFRSSSSHPDQFFRRCGNDLSLS